VLDRLRRRSVRWALGWAGACAVLFVLLGLDVLDDREPLSGLDRQGRHLRHVAARAHDFGGLLRGIEFVFQNAGVLIMAVIVALLLWRNYRRAAVYVVGVVVAAILLHWGTEHLFRRPRPPWQDVAHHVSSWSYPSGHVTANAALAGALAVLVRMLVRRRWLRRTWYAALTLVVVVVALDRLFLGRHYPTDVIGGALLAGVVVFTGLVLYSPVPRSHAVHVRPLVESYPGGHRLAVVLNPVKVESVGQFQNLVSSMARASGWEEPAWYFTTVDDPGRGMARAAREGGADLVVVCGGDGTIREVCAELAGTGIAVGIVPAGTGNLLARNLHLPLYVRAAVDVALTGQDRAVDLVAVSGDDMEDTHFLVMAGMGFDAAMIAGVNDQVKARVGWLAYVLAGTHALTFPARRFDISIDGGDFTRHRARTVVIGNVGSLQAGMPLLPDAEVDDGLVDVLLLHPQRLLSWIPMAVRLLNRQHQNDEVVTRLRGRTVAVRAGIETPRQLDGDLVAPGRELAVECLPGRVLVRVPRMRG